MKLNTLRKALAVGVIAAASGYAVQANAAFTFTEWAGFDTAGVSPAGTINYTNTTTGPIFGVGGLPYGPQASPTTPTLGPTDPSANPGIPANPQVLPLVVTNTMGWLKDTSPQSFLRVASQQAPALYVGGWQNISTVYDENNDIPGPLNWSNQRLWGRLIITDTAGPPTKVLDNTDPITLSYIETPNDGGPASCNPTPNPSGITTGCDDKILFTPGGLDPITFTANDGSKWLAEFRLFNLTNAAICGIYVCTGEGVTSHVDIQMMLTPQATVAEPSTLTLIGLGLLGLGFVARRRQNGRSA